MTKRNSLIDILKGIAMLLVIIGHSIQYANGKEYFDNELFYDNWFFKIIYTFHMPLFMLISGYLMGFSRKSFLQGLQNKIKTIVIPTVTFSILFLWNVPFSISFLNPLTTWFYWFLWSNLICYILFGFIKKINAKYLLAISFIAMFFIPDSIIISAHKFMYQMFLVGYWTHSNNLMEYIEKHKKHILYICTFLFILLLPFYNRNTYIYTTPYCILNDNWERIISIDIFRIIIAILGCIVFVISIGYIQKHLIKETLASRFLTFVGINSIGFYGFQFLLLIIIRRFIWPLNLDHVISTSLTFVILLIGCSLATMVCKRLKVLNIIFFGGR